MLDLFAGIGGFSLAATWLGLEVAGQVELDPWCRRVLAKHWPDVPRVSDVKDVRGDEFGPVDLVCGGFPCQPYSVAGRRGGNADDRALWPEMARIVDVSRPRYVLGENVPGFVSLGLDGVLADLEALGYACRPLVVPAVAVDARHRRDRVWILAHRDDGQRHDAQQAVRARRDAAIDRRDPLADADRERKLQPQGRLQQERGRTGDGCRWSSEPGVGRVADGIPDRVDRITGLGNAIVPQVAYEILRVMLGVDHV